MFRERGWRKSWCGVARERKRLFGGIIHSYCKYDPGRFPMPLAEGGDVVGPAFETMLEYGTLEGLTEEQLAEAVEIDPREIRGLGPSVGSLIAMLEARKRKILETYEVESVVLRAGEAVGQGAVAARPPGRLREAFERAVREEQILDLERLWYRAEQRSGFGRRLVVLIEQMGQKYAVEELASKYAFTGRRGMSVEEALAVKEELETIDRLLEQLRQAAKDAKVYLVDLEALARFAEQEQVDELAQLSRQVEEMLRQLAEAQGLKHGPKGYELTGRAMRVFQSRLLDTIFAELAASKTGRHDRPVTGEGAVELERTKGYEFGDSLANLEVVGSLVNALVRQGGGSPVRLGAEDLEVHLTRNTPKCATAVCLDMSGSMRYGGLYVNVKRMALALHGLIRTEYPGDYLEFVEVYTLARRRHISEVPALLPRPVTLYDPAVRLKVDMGSLDVTEYDIPGHFTNLQEGLRVGRQLLGGQDTPNRQIILITDGLPTAHMEANWLYLLYPPHRRTEEQTLREGLRCQQEGITINIFLLSTWMQSREDIQFAYRLAEATSGRVLFVGGKELERFVVWDYVRRRRFVIG